MITCALILHLASYHFGAPMQEINPGAGIRCNGYTSGAYRNSYNRMTIYAGRDFTRCLGEVCAGVKAVLATGYRYDVTPVAVPVVSWKAIELVGLPRIGNVSKTPFVGLSIVTRGWW